VWKCAVPSSRKPLDTRNFHHFAAAARRLSESRAPAEDVRKAMGEAQKNGKHALLMRVKSDNTTKFVAIPFVRA
jgi:hypothetical protein